MLPAVEYRLVCAGFSTIDKARLEDHRCYFYLKLLQIPVAAANYRPVDPPPVPGAPGEPEDREAEEQWPELFGERGYLVDKCGSIAPAVANPL